VALTVLAGGWLLGLALGPGWRGPPASLLLWGFAVVALIALFWTLRRSLPPGTLRPLLWGGLAALALVLGMGWSSISVGSVADSGVAQRADGAAVALRGQVIGDPEERGVTLGVRLDAHAIGVAPSGARSVPDASWQEATGRVQVRLGRDEPRVRYGDLLELRGTLEVPPTFADFDYRDYLARQGVGAVMNFPRATVVERGGGSWFLAQVFALRHRLAGSLQRVLPEPQASLAQALLLGIRSGLSSDLREEFIATGTGHLRAISGLHVGVLLGMALLAATAVLGGARWVVVAPLAAIWLYAVLTGMAPPVNRAAIMGSLYLGGRALGRQRAAMPALAATAAVMAGLNP
jgi:competence protein ComEC